MTVNLVSWDNGVGLTVDMRLLERVFGDAGHDVVRVRYTASAMRWCDVAVFLELFNPDLMRYAAATVGVFNLEWFMPAWKPWLPRITQLWAKSRAAAEQYRAWGLDSVLTGFASRDMHDPAVPRGLSCVHLRGRSSLKGTPAVVEAWRRHNDLPPLTIISTIPLSAPSGVRVLPRLSDDDLVRELNTAEIHVCPSSYEGWGHGIREGMSTGGVVVTTDASPMNEHVRREWGFLVPAMQGERHYEGGQHTVDSDALADGVRAAAALDSDARRRMGGLAREHVAGSNEQFRRTALEQLKQLMQTAVAA